MALNSTTKKLAEQIRQKAQEQSGTAGSQQSQYKDINKRLEKLETETIQQDKQHDPKTRSELTMKFVVFFFSLLGASYIFVLIYNYAAVNWMISLKEKGLDEAAKSIALLDFQAVISLVISGLGTSLGFIIGYYFKDKNSG